MTMTQGEAPSEDTLPEEGIAIAINQFNLRVGAYVLQTNMKVLDLMVSKEYYEARHNLIAAVGKEKAGQVQEQFLRENKSLFV